LTGPGEGPYAGARSKDVTVDRTALSTRDERLPAAYSARLESLSLAPLWTALHALLPPERRTRVVPHRWRWSELRGPLLEAARLVPIEQAERRVLVLCKTNEAHEKDERR
jgi:gentisate 1,2-dioxygenase